ncbi:hypothetical protein AC1031_008409 [Aphanomyces cochlioides]|nr:hypothetical protein AC1031_008409 [Aphanomyces cochlioides]
MQPTFYSDGLFKAMTFAVTAASIPLRGSAPTLYTVVVGNKASGATITLTKTTDDFYKFGVNLCAALDLGHVCEATCPWFFAHIKASTRPKHNWFLPDAVAVERNLQTFDDLFRAVRSFLQSTANTTCHRATTRIPNVLLDFLFNHIDDVNPAVFAEPPPTKRRLSFQDLRCSLCSVPHSSDVTTLKCGHAFHDECILDELNKHMTCPSCAIAATS